MNFLKYFIYGDFKVVAFVFVSLEEVYIEIVCVFNLVEMFMIFVFLFMDEIVGYMYGKV